MIVIVPNTLRDAINAKLDAALLACPEAAAERENFYTALVAYFNEHGVLPDIAITADLLSKP